MSINHFSTELPESQWWSHYTMDHSPSHNKSFLPTASSAAAFCLPPPSAAAPFDLNNEDDEELAESELSDNRHTQEQEIPKERLFEKPLTPSDVGKLNRLVIPKQHAEKHFPLNGGAESGENGLLLGFEDELGKSWRFRYSYWNSSQSYVLTKGWSRFVKEKRLDAGDIVVFARHRVNVGRLFIGWRRRSSAGQDCGGAQPAATIANGGGGGAWGRMIYSGHPYAIQQHPSSNSLHFQSEAIHAGAGGMQKQTSSAASGNSKTVRLFGVNLECQADESEAVGSPMSSHAQPHHQNHAFHHHHHQYQYYQNNHMDISFSGADVYRQG